MVILCLLKTHTLSVAKAIEALRLKLYNFRTLTQIVLFMEFYVKNAEILIIILIKRTQLIKFLRLIKRLLINSL